MNEVLRRKLFRTVLADSRAPTGILASSPEMVRTVQKRVGGAQVGSYELNLIPELVQRGDVRALQALTAPSYPKQVRLAASQALGSVTTKEAGSPTADFLATSGQQLARAPREAVSDALTDAGELGQEILDVAAGENRKFVDSVKTAARNDANRLSSVLDFVRGTGEIATPISEPGEGITALLKKGIKKMGSDLRQITDPIDRKLGYLTYDETEGMGLPTGAASVPGTALPATDLLLPEDDEFGNIGPDGKSVRTDYDFGEEGDADSGFVGLGNAPTKTVAEEVSETAVSGADTQTKTKEEPKGTSAATVALLDPIVLDDAADLDPDTSKAAIKKGTQDILNSDADDTTKNDALLELTNKKDPEKKLSVKDRAKANIELYEELLGESPEDNYNINNFLVDFGVAIASGRSDNALENITAALKPTVDKMSETKERKRARKEKIKLLGIQDAIADDKQEKQWERELQKLDRTQAYDWRKTLRAEGFAIDKLDAQIAAARSNLVLKLNSQIKIANNQQTNAAERDRANNEAALLRTQLTALPDAHQAAAFEFAQKGLDLSDDDVMKQFQSRVSEIASSLATTTGAKATDTDDLTVAYAQQYDFLSPAQARILAAQTNSGRLEEYGSVGEAIEQLFGISKDQQVSGAQKQGQAPAQTLAISSLSATQKAKLEKLPDGQPAKLGGVTYIKQGGNLVPK
jgi:hypothetical protein